VKAQVAMLPEGARSGPSFQVFTGTTCLDVRIGPDRQARDHAVAQATASSWRYARK